MEKDYLIHKDRANHKYLRKYMKNGRWVYYYAKKEPSKKQLKEYLKKEERGWQEQKHAIWTESKTMGAKRREMTQQLVISNAIKEGRSAVRSLIDGELYDYIPKQADYFKEFAVESALDYMDAKEKRDRLRESR